MTFNPWGPNEPAATILAEEAWLQGAMVAKIFYGVLLALSCQCFSLLWEQTHRSNFRAKLPFLVIVFTIFMFGTFHTGYDMKDSQLRFIENRNYPGGPSAFESHSKHDTLGNIAYVLMQWLCDALLIWRYIMIYQGCFIPTWILLVPTIIVYLGSCATGVLFLKVLSVSSPLVKAGPDWAIPYFSISLGLNILITIAIVGRLLLIRHRITSVLGTKHGSQYTTIAAMIVESASMYSAFSIFFIVPFALNSSISAIPLQTIGQVQGCATLLIVLRVASGKAWASNTQSIISTNYGSSRGGHSGGMQMNRFTPITFGGSGTNTGTAVDSKPNSSSHRIDHKGSAGSMLGGVTIIKDIHSDADGHSLDVDSLGGSCERV